MGLEYLKHVSAVEAVTLDELMDEYGDDVLNYAYAITKDRELAKDVAQETFIKAHYKIDSYRGQSSLKTWLFAIARNLALNYLSSSYIRRVLSFASVKPRQTAMSAEAAYIGKQSADDIWRIVMSLPDKLREALVLDLRHELSVQEMSGLLRIPEGTVKSRLHRARQKVEAQLKRWEHEQR
ncbi:RNA polymerase sigma factor [Cohnella panacarvi]|uniref:RNA polymerase sigma factor n=1 Tax=Cohnella panacarvi TaxID=400776 RepID=UPI00047B0BFF|nr:sigma-70 family RNA polymerase sigma factor [Cohnella panacarvi]